ncbi:hypothetical protein Tco_0388572 [Tanacetum coccineum]
MLWEWRGIANMDFIQLGGNSRVDEMILARVSSGFAGSWQLFEESVGSHAPRVIRFGTIPAIILIIPEAPIAPVDQIVALEDSLTVAPEFPLVSPFLCTNDSEVDRESEPVEQRPERHESLTPSSEFPLAPVVAPPGIHQWPAILVQLGEAIPFGRPYRTHPNRPHFTSDSFSSSSSLDSSSDISSGSSSDSLSDSSSVHSSGQSHTGPLTRVVSPRLVDPPVRTLRYSKAFMRWRSAPLFTLYPPTTSESSLDSSSKRSLDSSLPSDGPSLSGEEHMEMGTVDVETITDLGISDRVRAPTKDGIDLGVEVATSDIREDEEEFEVEANARGTMEIVVDPLATGDISDPTGGDAPDLEGTLYDMSHYMYKVPLDRITEFKTT